MTDVGLGTAESAECAAVGQPSEGSHQGIRLDRIPKRRSSSVRLDVADALRINLKAFVDLAHQRLLGCPIRRRNAIGSAVLIDAAAFDDAVDSVPIALSIGQAFQHDYGDAFGKDGSVG